MFTPFFRRLSGAEAPWRLAEASREDGWQAAGRRCVESLPADHDGPRVCSLALLATPETLSRTVARARQ